MILNQHSHLLSHCYLLYIHNNQWIYAKRSCFWYSDLDITSDLFIHSIIDKMNNTIGLSVNIIRTFISSTSYFLWPFNYSFVFECQWWSLLVDKTRVRRKQVSFWYHRSGFFFFFFISKRNIFAIVCSWDFLYLSKD